MTTTTTNLIEDEDHDDFGEVCDGCLQPGAECEADGFVFHNGTCWAAAEQRYRATREGARQWLRHRLLGRWDDLYHMAKP